jgi:tetratricopeptide (TPR) repeat protein
MEPVTLIATALALGAGTGQAGAAAMASSEARGRLRAMVQRKLAGSPDAELLLSRHERDPKEWHQLLVQELSRVGAGDDGALIAAARAVVELTDPAGPGEYSMTIVRPRAAQVGDGNVQVNVFHGDGRNPVGPGLAPDSAQIVVGALPQPAPGLQPREGLLEALAANGPGVSVVRAVTGMVGVGKTQLAAAYARSCIEAGWRLVAWVDAENNAGVLAGLVKVAAAMGIGGPGVDLKTLALAVRHQLEANGERCLLVLDNVTDLDGLNEVLPCAGQSQVVVTSTLEGAAALAETVPVSVGVFTETEALSFLALRARRADDEGAAELARELGCLPLALAQAAAVIARRHLDYATFLGSLRTGPARRFLVRQKGQPYPRAVYEAIAIALDAAAEADQTGVNRELVRLIALLSADGVSRTLLHRAGHLGILGTPGDQEVADPETVDEALGDLAASSLAGFSMDGTSVTVHRLTMRVARERAADEGSLAHAGASAVKLLTEVAASLPDPWQDRAASRDAVRQVLALHEHLGQHDIALTADLLSLRTWAIDCLNQLGDSSAQVVGEASRLVGDCELLLGSEHPETLQARNSLAYGYVEEGDLDRAIPLYEQNAADFERELGAEAPDTLRARNNLYFAYFMEGPDQLATVIPLYETALADCERVFGSDDRETLSARNNLAAAYENAGRRREGLLLHEQTLIDRSRVLGPDHRETLGSRNNLAHAYREAGSLDEATRMFEQSLTDCRRVLGSDHPDTHAARSNLARAYLDAGWIAEAVTLYEQALIGFERLFGPDHPNSELVRRYLETARRQAG